MPLLFLCIRESIACMKDAQVVRELNIAFLEVERDGVLLGEEVQRIKRFGLRFGDGRDGAGTR